MEASNVKAMREGLEAARCCLKNRWICSGYTVEDTVDKIDAALAAPPRNCDVGTVQEQFKRFQAFCAKYDNGCTGCPCNGYACTFAYCFAKWAQMPYEEGGAK